MPASGVEGRFWDQGCSVSSGFWNVNRIFCGTAELGRGTPILRLFGQEEAIRALVLQTSSNRLPNAKVFVQADGTCLNRGLELDIRDGGRSRESVREPYRLTAGPVAGQ